MSVEIPKVAVAFGGYGIPQGDVIECKVHLGCTKEVSSFDLLLQNWDGKYSPNGSIPLAVGMDGSIYIGRGSNVPQIITCRIESLKHESTPTEHYTRVSGRCWGERLFRRVFTGTFQNTKGEDIVKYLLDYYVGLSHVRNGAELVESTDTTYAKLEYENTPVFDIVRYIADSADRGGVVGYDFRVAPDGKFEFFPRNSKYWAEHGLVLHLPFDEGSGTMAYDHSNMGNNGAVNGAAWVDGKYGKALSFDGVDDYVRVNASASLDLGCAFTVSLWVYPNTFPQAGVMLWKGESYNPQYGLGTIENENGFRYWWTKNGTRYSSALISLPAQQWTHIVLRYDGTRFKCYKNGVDTNVTVNVAAPLDSFPTHALLIGKRLVSAYAPFNGVIDEVRVYNRALTEAEIKELYECGPPPLTGKVEWYEFRSDIHCVRNRVTVYGSATMKTPVDEDAWTESAGNWVSDSGNGQIGRDSTNKKRGSYSIKHHMTEGDYKNAFHFDIYARTGDYLDAAKYGELRVYVRCSVDCTKGGTWIRLIDDAGGCADYMIWGSPPADTWVQHALPLGPDAPGWHPTPGFRWDKIAQIKFYFWHSNVSVASDAWVDWLFFGKRRWEATQEDVASQNAYGLRELVEVDEELCSDNECSLRAKALLDYYKNPREHLTVKSTVIDYGYSPILPGHQVYVELPNEGVSGYFRVESVEYYVDAKTQTLEITLELGRETPLLADYLYALHSKTDQLSRCKIAR